MSALFLLFTGKMFAGEKAGWEELLKNNPQAAEEVFVQALAGTDKGLEDYEGLYQAELMQGKFAEAYQTAKKQVASLTGNALQGLLLLRLGLEADRTGKVGDYYSFVEELHAAGGLDGYTQTVAALIINKAYIRKNRFDQARAILKDSSRLTRVSRVEGPIYIPEKYGLEYRPEAENDLLQSTAFAVNNLKVDPTGKLELLDILPGDGRPGVAYVFITLEADEAKEAVLDLVSSSICKAWIDGLPIYSPVLYETGFVGARNSRIIQLHKGNNLILVKAFRNDTLQIGLREVDSGGRLKGVKVKDFSEDEWRDFRIADYSGRIFSRSYMLPFTPELGGKQGLAGDLWANFYYVYTHNYGQGIELNNDLLERYPDSAFIQHLLGVFYSAYYNVYESKARSLLMCENYMRRALELYPEYILPKVILSQILQASHQETSALKMLKEIVAQNSELPWVYRALADLYAKEGWIALADKVVGEYYKLYPENAADVISFYLNLNEYNKAVQLLQENAGEEQMPLLQRYNLLLRLNNLSDAEKAIKNWYRSNPQELNKYLAALIDIEQRRGAYSEVDRYLRQSLQKNPHNPQVMEALGANRIRMDNLSAGVGWFAEAHAASMIYKPSLPNIVRRIEVDTSGEFELLDYDIPLSSMDYSGVTKAEHERASYANLINLKVVRVFADLSSVGYVHKAFKILDNQGISQLAELNVGKGEVIECRTISEQGVEYIPESAENVSLDKAISMYNVSVGSVIEYSKRVSVAAQPKLVDNFEFESFDNPVLRSKYVLIIPKSLLNRLSIKGTAPAVSKQGEDLVLSWEAEARSGVEPEDFMPKPEAVLESVGVEIYSGKPEAPGLIAFNAPQLTTNALAATAKLICQKADTTREKVAAIYTWIADNIKSNGEALSARDAYLLRAGNAGAKLKLMQAMLAAVDVVAYPLLSNIPFSIAGRLSGEERVNSIADFTLPQLLRVENEDKQQADIWVRIAEDMRESRAADIGTLNQGALALESSPFGVRLGVVRDSTLEGVRVISPEINLKSDGSAEVSGGVEFFGSSAAKPRSVFYNSVHASQYAAQVAARLFPGIVGTEYSYPTPQELESGTANWYESFILTCRGRVINYCTRKGSELYFNPFREHDFVKNLMVKEPRVQPIVIPMDVQHSSSKRFTIPQGYVYKNVPLDRVIKSSFGLFILDYNVDGRELVVSGSILIPVQEIAPEDTRLYNEFLNEIKEVSAKGITLSKLDSEYGVEVFAEGVVAPVESGRFYVKHLPESVEKGAE